jgi:hypothetical protein
MAGKAPCVNVREHSGMVDVGVGQKYIVYLRPGYGWFYVFIDIEALFHAAVNKKMGIAGLQIMAASGYFVSGAAEYDTHVRFLLFCCGWG